MTHTQTRWWALGLFLTLGAVTASAQQVEYVTRNVQPTHAVRFTAAPIRIMLTDRGIRQPLASSPIVRHGRFCRCVRCGVPRIGGGVIIVRERATEKADCERPRSRTVYGRGHERRQSEAPADHPEPAADQRHLLRCLSMIQAQNRRVAPKNRGATADDR